MEPTFSSVFSHVVSIGFMSIHSKEKTNTPTKYSPLPTAIILTGQSRFQYNIDKNTYKLYKIYPYINIYKITNLIIVNMTL